MNDDSQTLERSIADFLVGFSADDIDDETRRVVKTLIKDQLAIQIGASQLPWSRQVRQFLRKPRPGTSSVAAEATRMDAADAAYLNACYGHGFEYDDVAGNAHPGCCVVPVALAVGEEVGATIEQMVVALIAGYEVYVRIGRIGSPDLLNNGWQPHSLLANFGAAAVAAKLHGFNVEQAHHALSIAMSHCSGTTEYTSTGGSIKRVHAGIGARNGIESAALARAGITGPRRYLTGNKGFFRTFIRKTIGHEARSEFAPGQPLQINQMWIKAYCCCGANHAYIDAMQQVRARAADIASVRTNIQSMTDACVGIKNEHRYDPRNIEELQYALPVQMALALLGKGNGYATHRAFLQGDLKLDQQSDVIRLARKIELTVSPDLDQRFVRNFVADVTVHFTDGTQQHVFLDRAKGMPSNPFTPQEHRAKLDELTHEVIGAAQAARLFDLVDRLDPRTPVGELTALLRREEG
jgi:2-methylcitrate dehydratase PrpD